MDLKLQGLENKTLLIIGGTGFVGRAILDHLNQSNVAECKVIVLSRGTKNFSPAQWPNLDLTILHSAIENLRAENLPARIDYIIHAATSTDAESRDEEYLRKTLDEGTKRVITLAWTTHPAGVLFVSSGAVYGLQRSERQSLKEEEVSQLWPDEHYGKYKKNAEELFESFHLSTKIPVTVARLFAFSGTNLHPKSAFAIVDFLRRASKGEDIVIEGNGSATRSYMDERDLAEWLLFLLLQNKSYDVVNVGSDRPVSISELADEILRSFPANKKIILNRPGVPENFYVPDITRAKKKYGLTMKHTLEDSIKRMIQSLKT
jgi:nucleoside-diphosphate-sugar epimerase